MPLVCSFILMSHTRVVSLYSANSELAYIPKCWAPPLKKYWSIIQPCLVCKRDWWTNLLSCTLVSAVVYSCLENKVNVSCVLSNTSSSSTASVSEKQLHLNVAAVLSLLLSVDTTLSSPSVSTLPHLDCGGFKKKKKKRMPLFF